jgi:fructosamine-3-kinase
VSDLSSSLAAALGQAVMQLAPVAGGTLSDAYAATLADGTRVFVKTSADPAAVGSYAAEAAGLRWLSDADALPLPDVLATGSAFLVLAWIDAGSSTPAADEALGRGLAQLHAAGAPAFGGPADTVRIGPLTLPNEPAAHWPTFYAISRLHPLARLARDRGALPAEAPALLDRLVSRLDQIAGPPEPPARVHGDLWSGNVLVDRDEQPWLIDPAASDRRAPRARQRTSAGPPGASAGAGPPGSAARTW